MGAPVIDPLGRYRYAKQLKEGGKPYPEFVDFVLPLHDKYWQSEDAMAEGSPVRALERGERVDLPPVLYIQDTETSSILALISTACPQYRQAGGQVELELFEGASDGFAPRIRRRTPPCGAREDVRDPGSVVARRGAVREDHRVRPPAGAVSMRSPRDDTGPARAAGSVSVRRCQAARYTKANGDAMQIIDVDSHVTVVKGLEDSPFQIKVLPDGGHLMEVPAVLASILTPPHARPLAHISRPSTSAPPGI